MMNVCRLAAPLALVMLAGSALAQWDPANGQWGKTDARDVRVMTWNVRDRICSSAVKVEGLNGWTAVARTVAALKPDILILQETGDNSGNGTGAGVDSAVNLETTVGLFLRGGNDPFRGNAAITSWVQKYAPTFDMPFVVAATVDDGFNRNVVLSRFPFTDLNGDTRTSVSNVFVSAHLYAPGGTFGIRGFQFVEINLPNAQYAGDLVIGNGHLKSGSATSDQQERLLASQNLAYYIDHLFNGAGGSTPDPFSKVIDSPAATSVLGPNTPVIWGGDMNEDENNNGRKGPVEWLAQAQNAGGTDGTDRDRGDSEIDDSRDFFTNNRRTFGSNSKLDYIMWQGSIAQLRRSFVFNSGSIPTAGPYPAELVGFPFGAGSVSSSASDHYAVVADFVLPAAVLPPGGFSLLTPANMDPSEPLTPVFTWSASAGASTYTLRVATDAGLTNVVHTSPAVGTTSYAMPGGILQRCQTYYWGVSATNGSGTTASTPGSFTFNSDKLADLNKDGEVDLSDFFEFFNCYDAELPCADVDGNPGVDLGDFFEFFNGYDAGC